MSKIKILNEQTSNLIAAGEVIDRPASVVKELIDNAIDANATKIQILIEDGGKNLIQVNDNGIGMDKQDALLCLEAHATSKITNADDLQTLTTFGFRGEALPSIASISQFTLTTKQRNSLEGTQVIVNAGIIHSIETTGRPVGTSIIIRNLFYNIPARRKFLKTQSTEESHIHEVVLSATLSRKDIAFELKFNQRKIFTTPATNDIRSRLALFMGRDMTLHILPVNYTQDGIHITGYISSPSFSRTSRKEQITFINNRPVTAPCLHLGIKEAYHTLIAKGRFAPVILYYTIAPNRFDINVHPAKREVRFQQPSLITEITIQAISLALRGITQQENIEQSPTINNSSTPIYPTVKTKPLEPNATPNTEAKQRTLTTVPSSNQFSSTKSNLSNNIPSSNSNQETNLANPAKDNSPNIPTANIANISSTIIQSSNNLQQVRYIAELHQKYILAENPIGLIIFEKKATLERILFEKLVNNFKTRQINSQNLLIPINIDIAQADIIYLKKSQKNLSNIGFELEHFGNNTFIITAIPSILPHENIKQLIYDIIDEIRFQGKITKIEEFNLLKLISQKASNAKEILGSQQCQQLIEDLIKCEMPYTCPRGKAAISFISSNELLRRFSKNK